MQTETDRTMFEWFKREVAEGTDHVRHNGWFVFANGARLNERSPLWTPPPADPQDLYEVRKLFLTVRLRQTKEHYERWRNAMESDAARCARSGDPLPFTEDNVAALKAEKAQLDRYQAEYDEHMAPERERAATLAESRAYYRNSNIIAAHDALRDLHRL